MQCNSLKLDNINPDSVDMNDLMKWIEFWLMDTQSIPLMRSAMQAAPTAIPAPANRRAIEIVDIQSN
jgi:hypothetical protein